MTARTSFLFLSGPRTHQAEQNEKVTIEPSKKYNTAYLGAEDNRVFRLETSLWDLALRYKAKVSLNPAVDNPLQIPETDHPELPEDVLPYINPSRYCESDRLGAM